MSTNKTTKLFICTGTIKALNPCQDRLDNWLSNYGHTRHLTLREFLSLTEITHEDKLWVVLKLVDNDTKVIFALDCAFAAYDYAANVTYAADAAAYAANAVYCAAYATYAYAAANAAYCAAAAASKQEQNRQLEALIYLIEGEL